LYGEAFATVGRALGLVISSDQRGSSRKWTMHREHDRIRKQPVFHWETAALLNPIIQVCKSIDFFGYQNKSDLA